MCFFNRRFILTSANRADDENLTITMMKLPSLIQRTCCSLVLFCLSSLVLAASEPAFWQVTQGKATVYLMGSMHFGDADFYPLPNEVERAYQRSDVLAVEVDMSKITPELASAAIHQHGRMPAGQTLSTRLSKKVYADLVERSERANLPLATLEHFQPWFVAVQLIEAEIRKTQLRQNLGIDLHFIEKGLKPVQELETLEQQLGLFGNLSIAEQEKFLAQTLADMDNSRTYLREMADAWMRGDTRQLENTLIDPFRDNSETKELFKKVFTDRNEQMTAAVMRYLAQEKDVFFVVGIGHMLGEQGIVARLRRQGINISRVAFADARIGE